MNTWSEFSISGVNSNIFSKRSQSCVCLFVFGFVYTLFLMVLGCDKLCLTRWPFFCEWCALVELLNSLDSRSSELAIDAHFIFMVRTTTRKAGKPRFYCCTSFLHRFKIVCQGKINFNNLLTLFWLFYSLDMNSVFFLVTASILFYPVWSGKLSSGW